MDLLQALKFVSGAVATTDYVPALQHVSIAGGRIRAFNGHVALSCPCPLDLQCAPRADLFGKAIAACTDVAQLSLEADGRLCVHSGAFRAFVPCAVDTFPNVQPEGDWLPIAFGQKLLEAIATLEPFVSRATDKPWANGILLAATSAFATNNTTLIEYWVGEKLPQVCIPLAAVKELLRVKMLPEKIQASDRAITFHFPGNAWMRAALAPTSWPASLSILLSRQSSGKEWCETNAAFFQALEQIKTVSNENLLVFSKDKLSVTMAEVNLPGIPEGPRFSLQQLLALKDVAIAIDFGAYPEPCGFCGQHTRGVIMGKL